MAFGGFDNKGSGNHAMSEINMVPLIDVMLVLLVIFIITAPLLAHSIKINLPQVSAEQLEEDPKIIDLALDAEGRLFWNEKPVALADLPARFATEAPLQPQAEIRIRADRDTRYDTLAQVMAAARRSGMKRIGFVTTPQGGMPSVAPASSGGLEMTPGPAAGARPGVASQPAGK